MRQRILIFILIALWGVWSVQDTYAWGGKKKKAAKEKEKMEMKQPPKKNKYESLFDGKKVETVKGLLTLHKVEGALYVEFPLNQLNKDMLIAATVSEVSDNRFANVGELTHGPMHVVFTQTDSAIDMVDQMNCRYLATDENITARLAKSLKAPVLERFNIEAYNPDSTAVVINMTRFFVGDQEELDPFSDFSPAKSGGRREIEKNFNPDKSMLVGVKAFRDNVSIQSLLSYMAGSRGQNEPQPFISSKPFTALMTRSITLLPEEPMRPRLSDPRIGVFPHQMVKFDRDEGAKPLMYAMRWRLEPKDEAAYRRGESVEPKQPIIFYIDDKFPEAWKPYIKAGVENWQEAFEKIGFKNAIQARDFPKDDPDFDPDNFKYSCIRYCPTEVANAMGIPVVDPRTGEIIHANVYIYHNIVGMLQMWRLIQTGAADKDVRKMYLPEETLGDCMQYVIAHEIGHTLALMHNMGASAAIPVDSLRSPSFTWQYGTTYSIMDYARNNYVAQPGDKERGVKLTPPKLGLYDYYAIHWLYTPLPEAKTSEEEVPILEKWISEKADDPRYRYGKQQMRMRIDPNDIEEDLGDDAMKAADYGIKNLKVIMKNMDQWLGLEDKDYHFRQRIYNELLFQYYRYLNHVAINIGGIHTNERYDGDPCPAYAVVAKEKQRRALRFLLHQIRDLDWLNSTRLQRGFPLSGNVSGEIEKTIFESLMRALMPVSLCEERAGKEAYTRVDYLNDIYKDIMQPTIQGRTLTKTDQKLQMELIRVLSQNSTMDKNGLGGNDVGAPSREFVTTVEIPDFIKTNSREDYGDLPEHMAGVFSNRDIITLQNEACEEEYKGYGEPQLMNFAYPISHNCYSLLRKIRNLMSRQANTGSVETRDFYKLMIFKLDKTFNGK